MKVLFYKALRYNPAANGHIWVSVVHKVNDFNTWLKIYDGEGTAKRATEGLVDAQLYRGIDEPNKVLIYFDVSNMAKAKAAFSSVEKKSLMKSAGVIGEPEIIFHAGVSLPPK